MPAPRPTPPAGRKPKRRLAPSEKYEIYVAVLTGQAEQQSAQVRPSTSAPRPAGNLPETVIYKQATSPLTPQTPPKAQAPAGEYAGEDTCLTCHDDMKKGYHDGLHGRVQNARTPRANQGCESCHGPGKAHAEAGGDANLILRLGQATPGEGSHPSAVGTASSWPR